MGNLRSKLTEIERLTGNRETVVVFWNAEKGYYRLPTGEPVDYRVLLSGEGALSVSDQDLKDLERSCQVVFVRWGEG